MRLPFCKSLRWPQFGLRVGFFGITLICVILATCVSQYRAKEQCLARLRKVAAEISFDYQWVDDNTYIPGASPPGNAFVKKLLGEYYAAQPRDVLVVGGRSLSHERFTDDDAALLYSLHELRWLKLQGTDITDEGLLKLGSLRKLERLDLEGSRVTPAGVRRIKALLPRTKVFSDFTEFDE